MDSILKKLSHVQREVLKLRYGIGYEVSYSIGETARIFKMTPGRVRSVQAKAEAKLTPNELETIRRVKVPAP